MQITPHFISEEFDSKDGIKYPVAWIQDRLKPLCEALEVIRDAVGGPLHITSGFRSYTHNRAVGGAFHSMHVEGKAVDIVTRKLSPQKLYNLIEVLIKEKKIPEGGLGLYPSWVHYDTRGSHTRW